MPSTEDILQGLVFAANHFKFVAWIWHLVFAGLVIILLAGRRPSKNFLAIILSLPLASVGTIAILASNPFNGIVFLLASLLFLILGYRLPSEKVAIKRNLLSMAGIIMIIYGWIYPHFLTDVSAWEYLYSAPTGLVPCPTLSIIIGFTLLFDGFGNKKWMLILAFLGLFYGIFGFFRLGVVLDIGLVAGALALGIYSFFGAKK